MDCMDCHNRPSHNFKSPSKALNEAFAYGAIDQSLPFFKREAIKALLGKYASHDQAAEQIEKILKEYYAKNYPEFSDSKKLNESIESVIEIYRTNFFPEMKASWKEYPDNIGHFIFPGCFRCHDGKHKSELGTVIKNDCNSCHTIIAQGSRKGPLTQQSSVEGLEFKHPDLGVGESWKEMSCTDCHTGGLD